MKKHPQHLNKILGIACLTILSAASTQAALWQGGTASYNNAANWNNGLIPSAVNTGNAINRSGAANVVQVNPGDPNWVLGAQDILLGDQAGTSGSYLQNGPNVTLNFWFRMGLGGATSSGFAELDAGTLAVGGRLNVGENGTAVFNMFGGTLTTGDHLTIADGGTGNGTFNQTNGSVTVGNELWVGNNSGAVAAMNLSGNASVTVNNWLAIGRGGSTGVLTMSNNATLTKAGGNVITFAGVGTTPNGTLNQYDNSTVNCANNDAWLGEDGTGTWNMNSGTATIATLQFGRNGTATGNFNLKGGTLSVNQITKGSGAGTLNFNGGTLRARAANASFVSGVSGALQAGGAVIDSQGFNIGISSVLADSASGGLTKLGTGTLTLSGANSYVGASIVQAGSVIVDTASLVTSAVVVSNGAGFGVSVNALNAQHSPTSVNLAGAASSLNFNLGAFGNPTAAPLNVTGNINVGGTVTVNVADSNPLVGQFPLVKYGTKSGAGTFVLGTLPAGVSATLSNNVGNSSIDLVISSTALIRWSGLVAGGVWDLNTTTNWTDYISAASAKFTTGAAVFFDDVAAGTTTINLGFAASPGSVVVTNDTLAYTLNGVGAISGATGLTKQGTNSLTIANVNSYTGSTVLSGGTLSVSSLANGGSPSAIGSSSASASSLVFGGGTLSYTGPSVVTDRGYTVNTGNSTLSTLNDVTFNGALASVVGGNFAKTGSGTLNHKRTGATTLSSGGGLGAYDIVNGAVIMDGSAGAQVNTVTGEFGTGTTTNSTGGTLILTNTTLNVSSWFSIARASSFTGATSSVALYNSTLRSQNGAMGYNDNIAGILQVGELTLNGTSTYTNTGDSNFAESAGGTANITLKDSSVYYGNNRVQLGWHAGATGNMEIANTAKVVVNAWMSIGNEGGTGSVLVKNSGTLAVTPQGDLNVCDVSTGTGTLTVQDSGTVVANNLFIGKGDGSTGTYNQNGGTSQARNGGGLYVEVSSQPFSSGTLNLNAGTFKARWIRHVNAGGSYVNFNGAQLVVDRDGGDGVNANFLEGVTTATVIAGANVDTGTNNISFVVPLVAGGAGGLTKTGTGTLWLSGANTYTGTTLVSAGTLGGNASIAGDVTVQAAGTITAGDGTGVGQLTIGGNLAIQGNIAVDIATSASPSNDVIVVTGSRSRTGTGSVSVRNLGPIPQVGQQFFLFNGAVTGAGTMAITGGGATWKNDLAVDGSITVLTVLPAPVFNPGSVATLPDGNKSVTGTGVVGQAYRLWASSDVSAPLNTWTLLNTGTITASPFTINDLSATNFTKRFYIFSAP